MTVRKTIGEPMRITPCNLDGIYFALPLLSLLKVTHFQNQPIIKILLIADATRLSQ